MCMCAHLCCKHANTCVLCDMFYHVIHAYVHVVYIHKHLCAHVHTCVCVYTYMYIFVHMYMCIRLYVFTHMWQCVYLHMYMCTTCACVHVNNCTWTYTPCTHTIHIHTHVLNVYVNEIQHWRVWMRAHEGQSFCLAMHQVPIEGGEAGARRLRIEHRRVNAESLGSGSTKSTCRSRGPLTLIGVRVRVKHPEKFVTCIFFCAGDVSCMPTHTNTLT